MKSVLGLIICFSEKSNLRDLTGHRTIASVLYGGRYRLVDFMLSSMVNSGIDDVGLVMRSKYQSLIGHMGSGKDWDLSRKKGGLVLLPPYAYSEKSFHLSSGENRSKVDALIGAMDLLEDSKDEYVVLADSNIIGNLPLDEALEAHIRSGKKMTTICAADSKLNSHCTYSKVAEDNTVLDTRFGDNGDGEYPYKNLDIYILRRETLLDMLEKCITRNIRSLDRDVFSVVLDEGQMNAFVVDSYVVKITDMDSYYRANMDLLKKEVRSQLFRRDRPILTHVHDENPCYYSQDAKVSESLIADGTSISGTVENSIIFRNVVIEKDVVVKNSIVMTGTVVQEGAYIENMIVDKNVTIRQNKRMMGQQTYPIVIAKDTVV